jgi:hypothetical protein
MRTSRWVLVGGTALLLVAATACAGGPTDKPLTSSHDLEAVCTRGTAYTTAPAHAGAAPHPVMLFVTDEGNGTDGMIEHYVSMYSATGSSAPVNPAFAFEDAYSPSAYATAQLVACVQRTRSTPAGRTCSFSRDTAPLAEATYELTVYETSTAAAVGPPVTLIPDSQDCPTSALVDEDRPEVYTAPSDKQYVEALRPYVEG